MSRPPSIYRDGAPLLRRPRKNFALFTMDEWQGHFPKDIFQGAMGELPIFMAVNVGYDPEDPDPYMYHYESQEVLFAYKRDAQKRVLMRDSHYRTLSLPLSSPITFYTRATGKKEVTVSEIVSSQSLPVHMEFARPECMDFLVDKQTANHTFFGDLMLTKVYEESFMWCLAIEGSGGIQEKPVVLPRNLRDVCFAPIIAIKGAADPKAKVLEFVDMYSQHAQQLDCNEDPFFQELAIVSRGPDPVEDPQPYMEQNTFVVINYHRRPVPFAPQGEAPSVPPRLPRQGSSNSLESFRQQPKQRQKKQQKKQQPQQQEGESSPSPELQGSVKYPGYCMLERSLSDEHVYCEPAEVKGKTKTQVVKPLNMNVTESLRDNHGEPPPLPTRQNSMSIGSTSSDSSLYKYPLTMDAPAVPPRPKKVDHSHLTVDDVSVKLKELGLGRHVKKFCKNRIDGVLLQKLNEATLKSEFKMTQVEFLLLQTFVSEGHIPKSNSSSSPHGTSKFPFKL
ncbi:uncharacterized protein [Littorina saxatilis]|uniref:CABIT domain-containing protein n=1 Tax=Littorina saxatilis TaxID=31220 RepID=A0AAN9AR49_9CAEN